MDVFDMEREQLSAASTAGNRFKDIFVSTHQIQSQSQIDWSHLHQMEISYLHHHPHHCLHHLCHHHHHCDYPHHYHHNLCHQSSINVQICRVAANPSLSDREHTLKRGRWQGLIFLFGKNMRGRFSLFFSFLVKNLRLFFISRKGLLQRFAKRKSFFISRLTETQFYLLGQAATTKLSF